MDNSSSKYFDACSNSKELNEIFEAKENNKNDISNLDSEKEKENKNIYESPQRSVNKNINIATNFSTGLNNSNQNSNLVKNMMISTKEQTNSETGKNIRNLRIQKKFNLYAMNSIKKNLMSPIEENIQFDFSNINSNEKINNKVNNINEVTNNNNNNININIIINKNKKLQNDSELSIKNKKSSNNKIAKPRNKNFEIINTNINEEKNSLYTSIDSFSNSIVINKKKKDKKININFNNSRNSEISIETNPNKIILNSISESLLHNNKNFVNRLNFGSFQNNSSLMINTIKFENIAEDILTVDDLKMKYNLRDIPVKRKEGFLYKNKYIYSLIELQIFNFGDCPIWVMKISHHGKYLAAGNKAGKIRIYELMGYDYDNYETSYNNKTIMNYLYLVNEKPIKELSHKKDITDLCWSPFKYNLLLSSSVDNDVILWDVSKNKNCLIQKYKHDDYVTCVQFSPTDENIFITGCFDKYIRIYKINDDNKVNKKNKNVKDISRTLTDSFGFFNITDKITSLSFYPDGSQIAIGTINGKIHVYDLFSNSGRYNHNFNCRNRVGKNSLGKKVTSINFINKKNAIISTCDSCVRLVSMDEGKNLSKYKGYVNENGMIRADIDLSNDIIIAGSEDGYCYSWKMLAEDTVYLKNYNYECFKPFERDVVECCIIVNEECFTNYMKKVLRFTNKINILSIIINSTDNGKIEVLLNINEEIN